MDSPLARVILASLGGYLIILLFLSVYDWIVEEYPRRPTKPTSSERIQHPFYHEVVAKALQQFSRLPKPEKAAIKQNLESNLISMEQWLTHLGQSDYQIMCMGELHEESTRNFLAEEFFAKFSTDVLLLEATPKDLKRLIKRMDAGRDYFPLLDADIMKILRSVKNRNPAIKIWGIEETDEQQKGQHGHSISRDQSIAHNFWDRFQPGRFHIILFGALHCTNEPNWLFKHLSNQASLPLKERMLNVRVLGEHQNGPVEAFVYFLDEIGIEKKHFVIPNTDSLHPRIYELFQMLNRQTLGKYRSLIVFRILS
ncbi:MAG: hypothetical protein OES64_04280 [Desulfobacteraceae bacterium]|nr:hypothetical protein [Desulfobacteraceae bacterium]